MSVEKKFCFKDPSGKDVFLFTLQNNRGTEVLITNYGAIITGFRIKLADGNYNDIVLGFDNVSDYLSEKYLKNYPYFGASCGRYANRIKNGKFVLDGTEYQLSQNMSKDHLHGGHEGFDRKVWELVTTEESPNPSITLRYLSADGEEGFPGNLEVNLSFQLNDIDELRYEYTARTDKPTAVNLTHHSYFNLNNGAGTIEDHEIKINSSRILAQNEGLVCNGEYIPVAGTTYDFRNFKKIGSNWDPVNGYDQCFEIDNKKDELTLVAEARSAESGIALQIYSTEPAVQFYTASGLGKLKGKNGSVYGKFSGFCLETHKHPNAINIPDFPDTVLRPGEKYFQENMYKILQS